MRLPLPERGERGERGAIAIMTAMVAVVLLVVAALAVDIATQVNERQRLHDTIDAAAHAGAYRLPSSGTLANRDAVDSAAFNDPALASLSVDFFCVVASKLVGGIWVVDTTQTPSTCYLAASKVTNVYPVPPARCNSKICSIPCNPAVGDLCNTLRVIGEKPVPFSFAPVIGINQGSTGSVSSAACKGSCGNIPLNPMDVAVVADRTSSMLDADVRKMRDGINGMFQTMTPSQQYVALGTIGRSSSSAPSNCKSSPAGGSGTTGPWMPVAFSNLYLNADKTLNTNSQLVQAVNCLTNKSSTGTHLASAMKAAARYLLGYDNPNDLLSLPARTGTVRKAIIFETDGAPNESITTNASLTALNPAGDIENTNKDTACTNLKTVATNAKNATPGILVVTVAYNVAMTDKCNGNSGARLDQTLAAAASPAPSGVASLADQNCADGAVGGGRDKENSDGDYFFCAGSGTDMAPIFVTAFKQLAKGIRLIQLP